MKKKLSRRDFLKVTGVTSASLILSACGVKATEFPTPTLLPSSTPLPTQTNTPTATLPTEPVITFGNFQIPKRIIESSVEPFINAIGMVNINLTTEQLLDKLNIQELKNKNGNPIFCLTTSNTGSSISDDVPLLVATQNEDGKSTWEQATQGSFGNISSLLIGETTTSGYFQNWSKEKEIFRGVLENFNLYVVDYDLMWFTSVDSEWGLRPSESTYNYRNLDFDRQYNKNKSIIAQTLLQSNTDYMPKWQKDMSPSNTSNREKIREIGKAHIENVIRHAPDIKYWGVISELENPRHSNYWVTAMGGLQDILWLKEFYVIAYQANPEAKLYYSDFDIEFGGTKADKIFGFISNLKEANTPISAVAFQLHLNGKDFISPEIRLNKMNSLRQEIARYKSIGIEILAPEMDIAMMNVSTNQSERYLVQAGIEGDLIKTLLEEGVTIISHFGGTDATNWRNQAKYGGDFEANATPFTSDGFKKPNYYTGLRAISNFLK